jgi:hypothetical protein
VVSRTAENVTFLTLPFSNTFKHLKGGKKNMSLLTARGQEAFDSATSKGVDLKKVYIRLKDGDSVRVRLLGISETTVGEFKAHGDFKKGIYTAPCISPMGVECPYCVASNSGVEGWDNFYARKRYLILFADIDAQAIRVWDASKQQGEAMLNLLEEYKESTEDMAFTFKRTGSGASDTAYHLLPILKLDAQGKEKFAEAGKLEVPANFFDSVLIPRKREDMIENLRKAGFPVADFFDVTVDTEEGTDTGGDTEIGEITDIAETDIGAM